MQNNLSPFSEVLDAYKRGSMVIIVDDAERENEGDLVIATEFITPEAVAFMSNHGRGLICVSMASELAEKLNLPFQVLNNNSPFQTPFAVSVDHKSVGANGILATSRAHTMRSLINENSVPGDFVSPGHVFPLITHPAGVLGRQGQTEGSADLALLAGLKPSGVICEILNEDGSMMRGADLLSYASKHNLPVTSVAEILRHRILGKTFVREIASAPLDTDFGRFKTVLFKDDVESKEHLALLYGDVKRANLKNGALVRIHSECLTGDVFGSLRCDCGEQLHRAMKQIVDDGAGILLYLRQEGRGIGLANKMKAYALQDKGHDTVEANIQLGFSADERDFAVAASILSFLGINNVRLVTNNPQKIETLKQHGIKVAQRVPVVVLPNVESKSYLETKRTKLGHLL